MPSLCATVHHPLNVHSPHLCNFSLSFQSFFPHCIDFFPLINAHGSSFFRTGAAAPSLYRLRNIAGDRDTTHPPPLPPHRRYRPVLNMYPMKSYKKSITVSPLMAHERRTSDNGSRVLSQIRIMIYGGKKSRSLRRSQLDEPSEPLSPSLH